MSLAAAMPLAALETLPAQAQVTWDTPRAAQTQAAPRTTTASRFDASFSNATSDTSVVARRPSHPQPSSNQQAKLKWRSSDRVAPRSFASGSTTNLSADNGPVMRVAYQQEGAVPDDLFGDGTGPAAGERPDPFNNNAFDSPFSAPPATTPPAASPAPDALRMPDLSTPNEPAPQQHELPPAIKPTPEPEQPSPLLPPTNDQRDNLDESKLDMLDNNPFQRGPADATDSPSDREPEPKAAEPEPDFAPRRGFGITPPQQRSNLSCEDLRTEVASRTISRISLDISPAYRPDVLDDEKFSELRTAFDKNQKPRDWRSIDGSLLGRGTLYDLSYQDVVIRTESGGKQKVDISRLSEADLAFLSKEWGLPRECRIAQVAYQPRNWTPATMTWKASNLCHNPLYFEEVQLERYGHSAGPIKQPLISTAHFFVNIAVLPYKMGIHPATECQYALGYYRPGNCAPYMLPPIPLSLRGTLSQAAVVAGGFWLIP
ncbi:hypothetical protein EC9_37320 [Rosistilla ulvae]|uniref:SLA1 homology domain-containing protein n=1 Tax=Rosistilla ulvae TaxID=1930277 RepID=A0A517M3S3_9BACT|nr:hypothetical protein [Rosistilla ulvae]QDS89532.1 hypothetical protein EC9_37320 [Rosistilla ulvae]